MSRQDPAMSTKVGKALEKVIWEVSSKVVVSWIDA
jgi:hypothetical protein